MIRRPRQKKPMEVIAARVTPEFKERVSQFALDETARRTDHITPSRVIVEAVDNWMRTAEAALR